VTIVEVRRERWRERERDQPKNVDFKKKFSATAAITPINAYAPYEPGERERERERERESFENVERAREREFRKCRERGRHFQCFVRPEHHNEHTAEMHKNAQARTSMR